MLTRKRIALVFLAIAAGTMAIAGEPEKTYIGVDAGYDYMLNAKDLYGKMLDSYAYWHVGASYGVIKDKSESVFDYMMNGPEYGVRASYAAAGALAIKPGTQLGDFFTVNGFFKPNFYKGSVYSIGPLLGVGLTYTPETWDPVSNRENVYIGTPIVVNLLVGIEQRFQIASQWSLAIQAAASHRSNGMLRVPNWGVNDAEASIALRYHLQPAQSRPLQKPQAEGFKKWNVDVYANGGVHACDVERDYLAWYEDKYEWVKVYPKACVGAGVSYRYHPLFATGIGTDLMYAGNWKRMEELDAMRGEKTSCSPLQLGFYLRQSLYYKYLELGIDFGVYAYKHMGPEDSALDYERISLRYHIEPLGIFVASGCRFHHYDRSDTIEFTIGKRF